MFKAKFSKGMVAVGAIGVGIGIWSLATGIVVTGAVLVALCTLVLCLQGYLYHKQKVV